MTPESSSSTPIDPLSKLVCLITGGTRGIGRAIAKMLAIEGASVAICGRSEAAVEQAVRELTAETGGKVKGKAADVTNYEQVGELFKFVDSQFGGLDVLVNNAGVGLLRPISELSVQDWHKTIDTNLTGVFYCCREALFRFETRGGGYIVNMSSLAGKSAFAGGAAYNASKFALTGFSEAVMMDKRSENVRVSYIMPGSVDTEFGGPAAGLGAPRTAGNASQDQKLGSDWKIWPEDIAEIVRMLLLTPPRTLISRVEVRPTKPKR
jgi:NAD(P)-dependent dehydrogenase (short-subunit alcohol dehydrogenase family)